MALQPRGALHCCNNSMSPALLQARPPWACMRPGTWSAQRTGRAHTWQTCASVSPPPRRPSSCLQVTSCTRLRSLTVWWGCSILHPMRPPDIHTNRSLSCAMLSVAAFGIPLGVARRVAAAGLADAQCRRPHGLAAAAARRCTAQRAGPLGASPAAPAQGVGRSVAERCECPVRPPLTH